MLSKEFRDYCLRCKNHFMESSVSEGREYHCCLNLSRGNKVMWTVFSGREEPFYYNKKEEACPLYLEYIVEEQEC